MGRSLGATHSQQNNETSELDFSGYDNLEQIRLEKGPKGLGFAIMYGSGTGDNGIFIKTLIPGGPAATVSTTATTNLAMLHQLKTQLCCFTC